MKSKNLFLIIQITLSLLSGVFAQEMELPEITLFIEKPVAEQKIVLTAEEIREKNVESLTSLLESAGVQLLSYGPYGLESKPSIRGFTDETVRVVIDGICVNNAQYGTFDFTSIDVGSIEKIEIVKGGFTEGVSDEGAVGGVIYITTRSFDAGYKMGFDSRVKTFFNGNSIFDTFNQKIFYGGQIGEAGYLKTSGDITFAKNRYLYRDSMSNNITERRNAQVLDGSGEIKYSQYFGGGNQFFVSERFYGGDKETPGPEYGTAGRQKDYDNSLGFNLRIPKLLEGFRLDSSLTWLSNLRFYNSPSEDSRHFVNSLKFMVVGEYSGCDWFGQTAGITFDYTNLDSTNDGKHNQFTGTVKETSKIKLGEKVSFSVPMALKFCDKNLAFIPKLGMKVEFGKIWIMTDAYRMVQFPNMDDLYWEGDGYYGNPDLKPESGWGGDIGVNFKLQPVEFSCTVFTNYYANKIQWAGNTPQNIASAFYLGLDCSLKASFLEDRLNFSLNGEYLYNRLLDKSNSLTYGKKIMWTPDFTFGASAVWKEKKFNLNLEGNFVGKRYTSNLNVYFVEPYFLLNASGEFTGWENFTPYFRAENLLNARYEAVENYPMPGISFTIGVKFALSLL